MKSITLLLLVLAIRATTLLGQETPQPPEKLTGKASYFGLGAGLPYGWFGMNLESPVYKKLYLLVGIGAILDTELSGKFIAPGYSFGPSIHLQNSSSTWQPQFYVLYGRNGYYRDPYYPIEVFNGVTVGMGHSFMFGKNHRNGISIDILCIASSGLYQKIEDLSEHFYPYQEPEINAGRLKLGIGYKRMFTHK